ACSFWGCYCHFFYQCHWLQFTFWNGWCIGNTRWSGLWSRTISKGRNLHLLFNLISHYNLPPSFPLLDFYGRILNIYGSRPSNFTCSQHLLHLAHPCIICRCYSSITGSLFPVPEPNSPIVLSSCATICFHVPLCWVLVHKTNLGYVGAALAITLALWFNVIVLGFYMRWSASCESTRTVIVGDVFASIKELLSFALPSAVMCCLEWWSFELLVLLSGLLPDSELETSVLSICLSTTSLHYFVPYGVGAAASTRVSNELGAGNPHSARVAVNVVMILGIFEAMIVSITLFSCRYAFGYLYSNEQEVIDYVGEMIPLISLSVIVDSLLAVISGVARGTGWQHIGAYVNLGAYYLVGIPVAALLCFSLHLRGKGLWIGILTGSSLQLVLLALVTGFTNWQKQATKAQERIFEEKFSNGLLA
ncbi:hypothetical protein ERO13_A07G074900v2, partial [Gossypium hirsutum]